MKKTFKNIKNNNDSMKKVITLIFIVSFLFTIGLVLAEEIGFELAEENPEIVGGCGGTQDPDACCVNLGYDSWDSSLDECISTNDSEPISEQQNTCETAGGTWKTFNNGCVDSCDYARNPSEIICTQAITEGCDCGEDMCWNGESCEANQPEEDNNTIEIPIVGGCGATQDPDACCVNLGYEVWDSELEECIMSSQPGKEVKIVCCKVYGYGSEMQEVNVKYVFIKEERCSVPENFVGGNREIVDNSFCREQVRNRINNKKVAQERPIAVQNVIQARNRLEYRIQQANGTCPANCTCEGSTIKCTTQDGNREIIIRAGNSGNTIVQVKNTEMQTSIALFKADDGGVFGVFKNNETKRIILPDEARERLHEKMKQRIKEEQRQRKQIMLEDENITLNEEGYYDIQAKKRARLFWLIPVKERIHTEIDAETGDIIKQRNPWWGFLARDVRVNTEDIPE